MTLHFLRFYTLSSVTKRVPFAVFSTLNPSNNPEKMQTVEEHYLDSLCKKLPPALSTNRHKGQAGRIGVIGGSLEYTGAPYFSGISALKVGADLTHIFCTRDAASVIKSYSPELIVHPLLDNPETAQTALEWIERLHVIVLGPGLGRKPETFAAATVLLTECRRQKKPLIIDADGLFMIKQFPQVVENYPSGLILTPNSIEYSRLFNNSKPTQEQLNFYGKNCTIVRKGSKDEIFNNTKMGQCTVSGSGRRCGGQGDLLSGSLAIFYWWALNQNQEIIPEDLQSIVASYAACKLTRKCNSKGFKLYGRSMTCSNMISQIGSVFNEDFEL